MGPALKKEIAEEVVHTRGQYAYAYTIRGAVDVVSNVLTDLFNLPPAMQHRLADALAANVGYELTPEPEHPDSPHRVG